jgi:hypothetical protein
MAEQELAGGDGVALDFAAPCALHRGLRDAVAKAEMLFASR